MKAKDVLEDVAEYLDVSFIAYDIHDGWMLFPSQPTWMKDSKGWFSPKGCIKLRKNVITEVCKPQESLRSLSNVKIKVYGNG